MKNVLITGASGAIGLAIAEEFAAVGANVALNYHTQKEAAVEAAKRLSEKYNVKAVAVKCDVSNSLDVKNMIAFVKKNFGFIDTLINNAGVSQQKLFTDITDEDFDKMIGVNLKGVFYCTREVLHDMIDQKRGSIVNISSMWGQTGGSCETHYSAAKAGVIGLTKALAKEVAPSNVRVNCVSPGVIKTPMLNIFSEKDLKDLAEETPLERLGTPEDVAKAVVFLASDNASFITGQVLGVNGGFII